MFLIYLNNWKCKLLEYCCLERLSISAPPVIHYFSRDSPFKKCFTITFCCTITPEQGRIYPEKCAFLNTDKGELKLLDIGPIFDFN